MSSPTDDPSTHLTHQVGNWKHVEMTNYMVAGLDDAGQPVLKAGTHAMDVPDVGPIPNANGMPFDSRDDFLDDARARYVKVLVLDNCPPDCPAQLAHSDTSTDTSGSTPAGSASSTTDTTTPTTTTAPAASAPTQGS